MVSEGTRSTPLSSPAGPDVEPYVDPSMRRLGSMDALKTHDQRAGFVLDGDVSYERVAESELPSEER